MRPFTRTIIELFDSKRRYLIPLYQRQYAWKVDPHLEYLWEDVTRIANNMVEEAPSPAPHFMGAIVISLVKTFGKQVQAFEVIDGQQRLTTFQLLLIAFRRAAAKYAPLYAEEVEKYIFNFGIMEDEQIERYKIWPSRIDRPAFVALANGEHPPTPGNLPTVAMKAESFFFSEVERFTHLGGEFKVERLEKLFEALKSGLAVVSIELETHDDPQTIFETLNSRGVDLAVGDLVRNFIFQRAVGLGQEDGVLTVDHLYEKYWLPLDGWFWKEEDTRGRLNKQRLDWLLFDHLSMSKGEIVSAEYLYQNYRKWIVQKKPFKNVTQELIAVNQSANTLKRVVAANEDDPVGAFGIFTKAFDVSTTMPFVLFIAENLPGNEIKAFLTFIESYLLRRDVCGLSTGNYNRFFIEAVKYMRQEGVTLHSLITYLSLGEIETTRWPNDDEYRSAWMTRPQYKSARQPRLKYILRRIDQKKRTKFDEVLEVKSDLTLEHIMPQKWSTNWPLLDESGQIVDPLSSLESMERASERNKRIQSFGNLTLLTQSLNGSVSNAEFSKKMPSIKAQGSLILNRELSSYDKWNENTIDARGHNLFNFARQLWPLAY